MTKSNPIICALDTTNVGKAKALATSLSGSVGAIKLGLEFFTYNGVEGVKRLEEAGLPIFLDLKFHDIPNTVAGAIRALSKLDKIFMTTVHISGGKKMMEEASRVIKEAFKYRPAPAIVGVTVLTSLDQEDLQAIGVGKELGDQVISLAKLARSANLDGIVCSPLEVETIRKKFGEGFKLVVPGIRPNIFPSNLASALLGEPPKTSVIKNDDQKRTMTPKEAIDAGADYLVIGRPITAAPDPAAAAKAILESL